MSNITNGIAYNLENSVIVKTIDMDSNIVFCGKEENRIIRPFVIDGKTTYGYLCNYPLEDTPLKTFPYFVTKSIENYNTGDILLIDKSGYIKTLYQKESKHNYIFFTEYCNHNCIMCSQPATNSENFKAQLDINKGIISLLPKEEMVLGITGGEPTLFWKDFNEYIALLQNNCPEILLHILTNGRTFYDYEKVLDFAKLNVNNIVLAIPVHSDYFEIHDRIVNSSNAFYDTIQGLYYLAKHNIRIEIRFVILKINYHRMVKFARFLYKYLPFVEHVAFMGLEPIGNAQNELNNIWISPDLYMDELEESIEYLNSLKMNASIYNLPLCCIPDSIIGNYRKSISEWKNIYLDECENCINKCDCGGFFSSAKNLEHKYLKPIKRS